MVFPLSLPLWSTRQHFSHYICRRFLQNISQPPPSPLHYFFIDWLLFSPLPELDVTARYCYIQKQKVYSLFGYPKVKPNASLCRIARPVCLPRLAHLIMQALQNAKCLRDNTHKSTKLSVCSLHTSNYSIT